MSDGGSWNGSCDDAKRRRNASADCGSLLSRICRHSRFRERNVRDLATNSQQPGHKNDGCVKSDNNPG